MPNEITIAIIGAIGGIILALAMVHKNAADVRAKAKETDISAGKLALDIATQLKQDLIRLEEKAKSCEETIEQVNKTSKRKDTRIVELERITVKQQEQIEDQDRKLTILTRLNQEKSEVIAQLTQRLEVVEKANGGTE